jgi:hypothetical protein
LFSSPNFLIMAFFDNIPLRPIGLWDAEAPTFSLDNRLTDSSKVVSLAPQLPFTPQEDSWYSFLLELSQPQGHSVAGRIKSVEKIHLIRNRIRDLPACKTVPKPTTLPRTPPPPPSRYWTVHYNPFSIYLATVWKMVFCS